MRFPEFEDDWEVKALGSLLEFKNGINATKEQYGKGIKFVNVSDILNNDFLTYQNIIGSVDIDNSTLTKYSVEYGDILFQRSSETREEVGTANVYLDKENIATFGGFVIRGKKTADYNPIFLNNLLKTSLARNSITSRSGGSTRYNVGQEILSSVELYFPSINEQEKIGNLISVIDERLRVSIKTIDLLKVLKTSLSSMLFSQQLRFKDENGNDFADWDTKEVGEVFKITRGNVLAMSLVTNDWSEETPYPVYSSQTKNKGLAGYYKEFLFENVITWTTDGANAGDVNFRSGKFYCTNVCGVLINEDGYANVCIAELINSVSKNYVSYVGNPKLMNGVMSEIQIPFPSLKEQQKIANFLSSIDTKIEIETNILQKLEEQKKFLLQNMFV